MKFITFFIILEDVWSKVTTLQQSFYIDIDKMKNKSSVQNIWVFLSWLSKVKNIWQKKNCDFFPSTFPDYFKKGILPTYFCENWNRDRVHPNYFILFLQNRTKSLYHGVRDTTESWNSFQLFKDRKDVFSLDLIWNINRD